MNNQRPLSIGIVGTGEMGRQVVNRLLTAGHRVAAYARRAEVKEDLRKAGVEVTASVTELAQHREFVLLYVFSDAQVRSVAIDDGLIKAMAPGSVLIIHSTGSPRTAKEIADYAQGYHVGVIDAPASGGPSRVAAGELTLFIGGPEELYKRCKPVLDCFANRQTHFGELGSGQIVKLINNLLFGAHIQLALEAARIAKTMDIDAKTLADTLHSCSGQSYSLDLVNSMGSPEVLVRSAGRFIYKDATVATKVATELGIPLGTLEAVIGPMLENMKPYAA